MLNELQRFYESEGIVEKARWASEQMQVVRLKAIANMKQATVMDFLTKKNKYVSSQVWWFSVDLA